jgi:hypothetical protein
MRGADHARIDPHPIAGVIAFCIVCFIGIAIQLIFAGIVSMTMKLLEWGEP